MGIMLEFQKPPGKPLLRGKDHYWDVICRLDAAGPWTIHDIDMQSRTKARGTILEFVKKLVAGNIAALTGETVVHRNMPTPTYRLLKHPSVTPSLTADGKPSGLGRAQAQMWNVLRGPMGRSGITTADLALYATTEQVHVAENTAYRFAKRLEAAGYLVAKGSPAHFKLVPSMNTGPKPPAFVQAKFVYDRNLGKTVGSFVAEEAKS